MENESRPWASGAVLNFACLIMIDSFFYCQKNWGSGRMEVDFGLCVLTLAIAIVELVAGNMLVSC